MPGAPAMTWLPLFLMPCGIGPVVGIANRRDPRRLGH
jgi:hypothetical protein